MTKKLKLKIARDVDIKKLVKDEIEECYICRKGILFNYQKKVIPKNLKNDRIVLHHKCSIGSIKWIRSCASMTSPVWPLYSKIKFWVADLSEEQLKNIYVSSDGFRRRVIKNKGDKK